jgi:hypothetical protein
VSLQGEILLLAFRTAHYTDAKTPRAQSKEFKLLEEAVEYLATSIEELVDRRVQEVIDSLQANGYIPV